MNTAGRGDELLLGLQLEENQELEQILEKAAKKLPDVTICCFPNPGNDPFTWVSKLPQIPRVKNSGFYHLAISRPQDEGNNPWRSLEAGVPWKISPR